MNGFSLWRYEMRATVLRPAPLFLSFFIPLAIILIAFLSIQSFFQDEEKQIQAAIVDHDRTFETKSLVNQLSEEERMKRALQLDPMTSKEALEAFERGDIAGIMTIPEGFTKSLRVGENEPITVMTNQDKPLDSTMLTVLLESGAKYISASQSAVNAVYDLHIKQLPGNERNQKLQEAIVTFTLFALDRNEAFEEERVVSGASVGWKVHAIIAIVLTFVVFFTILYQALDGGTDSTSMSRRWRMVNLTFMHQVIIKQLKWWLVLLIVLEVSVGIIAIMKLPVYYSAGLHLGLLLVALWLSAFAVCLYGLNVQTSVRSLILVSISVIGIISAGAIVPEIYLPDWLYRKETPFALTYDVFLMAFGERSESMPYWGLALWGISLSSLAILAGFRKEKRDAYVSVFTSK
ncbi:ABC transporter permease [Pontibacillus sp. ALD_SL1]|uniref:ABC transporter permease n=1 Tax=Pontibacillus sp. ALD_SL1 TaxID=2777185 RepID=UPI001A979E47|nr:ABC transporter permease [Pontibacillus sp. ALD_SL1]QST00615.1 ABC transporter permease [Pontibacillus sp. ALD_SL1]